MINLKLQDTAGEHHMVKAYRAGDYFAVHKKINGAERSRFCWSLTHIPTGRQICRTLTRKDAKMIAALLEDAFEWDFDNLMYVQNHIQSYLRALVKGDFCYIP